MRNRVRVALAGAGVAAIVLGASALPAQRAASGPKARYQMDVATTSGFGGMGAMMGGGNPMAGLFGAGRGGSVQHTLLLRLGSTLAPTTATDRASSMVASVGSAVAMASPSRRRGGAFTST